MKINTEFEKGDEVLIDQIKWAIIDEVIEEDNGEITYFLIDEDGKEYELKASRLMLLNRFKNNQLIPSIEDNLSDIEVDAMTLRDAGMGMDEDYRPETENL